MLKSSMWQGWVVAACVVASTQARAVDGVTSDRIVIGQTAGFTGIVAAGVKEATDGARAYFDTVNRAGGIDGRRIELVSLDDKFDPKIAGQNCETLIVERKVFALFLTRGTPHAEACLPVINQYKVPLIAPSTGAQLLHEPVQPYVFNVRAKYQDEVIDAIRYFSTVGQSKIALVHVDDSFGKDARAGFERGMERFHLKPTAIVVYDRVKAEMAAAAAQALRVEPDAVVIAGSGQSVVDFIKAFRAAGGVAQLMTLSNNSSAGFVKNLGDLGHGVIVSQIAPSPTSGTTALGRAFQSDTKAAGVTPSYAAMEGYMAARVLVEGLKRAGASPRRESLVSGLESLRNWDMGGVSITYSPTRRTGSEFTELSIIDANGRFVR